MSPALRLSAPAVAGAPGAMTARTATTGEPASTDLCGHAPRYVTGLGSG